jgi:hypothetical protein
MSQQKIPVRQIKAFKTAVFKLHRPTRCKRAAIEHVMKTAQRARETILEYAKGDFQTLAARHQAMKLLEADCRKATGEAKVNLVTQIKVLKAEIAKTIYEYRRCIDHVSLSSGVMDGIQADIEAMLTSHLELMTKNAGHGFPESGLSSCEFPEALSRISSSIPDDLDAELHRLQQFDPEKPYNPITFPRNGRNGFMLLRKEQEGSRSR